MYVKVIASQSWHIFKHSVHFPIFNAFWYILVIMTLLMVVVV